MAEGWSAGATLRLIVHLLVTIHVYVWCQSQS